MLCSSHFVKDNQHFVKMFSFPVYTYKSSWISHIIGEKERQTHTYSQTHRESVCMSVCYQLSRRVTGCPRFWTKFSGISQYGFSPLFTAVCQHDGETSDIPVLSSGENADIGLVHTLQGLSPVWIIMCLLRPLDVVKPLLHTSQTKGS